MVCPCAVWNTHTSHINDLVTGHLRHELHYLWGKIMLRRLHHSYVTTQMDTPLISALQMT